MAQKKKLSKRPKTITFGVDIDPDGNGDVSERPSCCHVYLGQLITFRSKLRFSIHFKDGRSAFHDFDFDSPKQTDPVLNDYYVVRNKPISPNDTGACTPSDCNVFGYTVLLIDAQGNKYRDGYCPTIIVGDLVEDLVLRRPRRKKRKK